MITHDEMRELLGYTAREGVAISFYLNTDVRNKETLEIETKDLIKDALKELTSMNISRSYMQAAKENLEEIRKLTLSENTARKYKSAAVFTNSTENFLKVFRLPMTVKSNLVIDTCFYVRPLLALLQEHYRIGMVLIDSRQARLFEIYMGEIIEHHDFGTTARNPKRPLLETLMKKEKKLAQKKEDETRLHLMSVADSLRLYFMMHHFDKLVIGAKKPLGEHFARLFHPKLHDNLIGMAEIDMHATENEILAKALGCEKEFELAEENKLLRRISNEVERDGYAVRGLKRVVEAMQDYNVQTLAVAKDFTQPGLVCLGCGMPHISERPPKTPRSATRAEKNSLLFPT